MDLLKKYKRSLNEETEKLLEEKYNNIISNKELMEYLKSIGFTSNEQIKENVSNIDIYYKDREYCKSCPGMKLCDKDNPHYLLNLQYDGEFIYRYLCPCKLKKEDEKLDEKYIKYEFDKSLRTIDIKDMDLNTSARKSVAKSAAKFIKDDSKWLYIHGSHRTGKTFSSICLLNTLINLKEEKGCFINFPKNVNNLNYLYFHFKEDFTKEMNILISAPILVLDDFGNEYKNDITRDFITLPLLLERSRRGLITIFNSLYSLNEIKEMYTINAASKAKAYNLVNLIESISNGIIDYGRVALY